MIIPADYLFPVGELRREMFSATQEELVQYVTTWGQEGEAAAVVAGKSGAEAARIVEATIYARGFRAAVDGLLSMPATSRLPDGNQYGYTAEQFAYWQSRATFWEGRLGSLLPTNARPAPNIPGTIAVPVRWVV